MGKPHEKQTDVETKSQWIVILQVVEAHGRLSSCNLSKEREPFEKPICALWKQTIRSKSNENTKPSKLTH
jgi:hypothetical protein